MDWPRLSNAINNNSESSHALDSWWQDSTRETKGDLEKINREGNKNTWMKLQRTENIDVLWLRPYVWSHTKRIK